MKVYPEKIKIIPPYITFKLKEIPCGVSFSQKKKDKQDKILETRKQEIWKNIHRYSFSNLLQQSFLP